MSTPKKRPFSSLPPMQQAGMMCADPRFQKFAAERVQLPTNQLCQTAATEYLRRFCGIESRRELQDTPTACEKLQILRNEFDAWLGKTARPEST